MNKKSKIRIVLALLLSISLLGGFESLVFANSNKPIDLGVSDVMITDSGYFVDESASGIRLLVTPSHRNRLMGDTPTKFTPPSFSFRWHQNNQKTLAHIINQLLQKKNIPVKGKPYEKTITQACSSLANNDLICTVTFRMNENNFLQGFFGQTNLSKATYQLKIPICRLDNLKNLYSFHAVSICNERLSKKNSPKNKTSKPVVIKKK